MEIRELTENDAELYWPLRLRALREEPDAFGSDYEESRNRSMAEVADRLRKKGPDDVDFTLGAFEDGLLVGTIAMRREPYVKYRHKAMIAGMYVPPEARGKGVGRALLLEAIERARRVPGLLQLYLSVMLPKQAARALYRSTGFEVFGVEPRSLRIGDGFVDAEQMVLMLDTLVDKRPAHGEGSI